MQDTSNIQNWDALWGKDETRVEVRATVAGTAYDGFDGVSGIWEIKKTAPLLKTAEIGRCAAARLDLALVLPEGASIPRMAQIDLGVRLNDGTTQSGWLPKGTFFIDTRTQEDDVLKITAYDAMLKTEQSFTRSGDQGEWPRTDISVVNEIAQRIGVSVDARTTALMSRGYLVQYPGIVLEDGTPKYSADGGLTMREVLGYIGVMYGGDWCISDAGELRLVPLTGSGDATVLGNDVGELETSPAFDAISRVTLIIGTDENGDEVSYTAGDDTGRELTAKCPWATQAIADNLLTALGGYVYQPFTAGDALLDPAAELGDAVIVGDITSQLGSIETTFDALYTANIEAPQDEEIDHEYPYEPQPERTAARKTATVTAELRVMGDTISSKVSSAEAQTLITQNLNSITLSASAGSNQSTVTISAGGITVDSAVVRFSNIVADSIVANASIVAPTIYATGQRRYLEVTTNGITYNSKVGSSFQPSWSIGNSTSANNTLAINSYTDQGSIMIGCAGRLYLQGNGGLVLNGAMYGTLAQRPAAGTAGRIFFVRS